MDLFVCFAIGFCLVVFAYGYSARRRDEPCHAWSHEDMDADLFRAVARVVYGTGADEGCSRALDSDGDWVIDIKVIESDDSWAAVSERPSNSASRRGGKRTA